MPPGFGLSGEIGDIEQQQATGHSGLGDGGRCIRRGERHKIDKPHGPIGLDTQMQAEVGLLHGRDRMPAHHGMPVDAKRLAPEPREQVPEGRVALELWRPNDERNDILFEHRRPDVGGLPDTADARRGIEGGADFVVADRGIERAERLESRGEVSRHPGRALAAARARDTDGARAGKARALRMRGGGGEQHGGHAARGERFHHVSRARQVIAIIRQKNLAHAALSARPNVASEAASSGCSFA